MTASLSFLDSDMIGSSFSYSSAESSFREHDDVYLQTKTRIWLGEVLHTRLDDQINLSELLADGELLLDVSKIVWDRLLAKFKELRLVKGPKSNPIGSRRSIGRYKPYSNVDSFLKICKILRMYDVDLFSPSDVVEKRDTRKVPDFDNVTYTVTMPTVMVGCLRRSLELSKCSSKDQQDAPNKDYNFKSRQKYQLGVCDGNNGSCSEESDDTEGNRMGRLTYSSYSLSNSNSYDIVSQKDRDDSPEVDSALCTYEREIQELVKNAYETWHYESRFSEEPTRSFCSQYGESSPMLNNLSSSSVCSDRSLCTADISMDNSLKNREAYFLDDTSFVGDSPDDMIERLHISPQFAFPDITLGLDNGSVLFDGEDNVYNLLMGSDSQGFISTARTFENRFERRSSVDFDEVSSVSSMSSVLGRVLTVDFDEEFDHGDLKHESQDIDAYENSEHSCISDAENSNLKTKDGNSGFSSNLCLSCSDSQLCAVENEEHIGSLKDFDVSQLNSVEDLDLKNEEKKLNSTTINEANRVIRESSKGCLIVPCNYVSAEKYKEINGFGDGSNMEATHNSPSSVNKSDRNCLKPGSICSAKLISKDQSKYENVENLLKFCDGQEDVKKKTSKIKPHKGSLLGTVVKGTAVFGMMFFLLHLRKNQSSNENRGESDKKTSDIHRANSTMNTIKAQTKGRENGIYPDDKFKFQN